MIFFCMMHRVRYNHGCSRWSRHLFEVQYRVARGRCRYIEVWMGKDGTALGVQMLDNGTDGQNRRCSPFKHPTNVLHPSTKKTGHKKINSQIPRPPALYFVGNNTDTAVGIDDML